MSNSYLCDGCDCQRESIDNEICAYRLKQAGKIVLPDGYQGDLTRLCAHWKDRG